MAPALLVKRLTFETQSLSKGAIGALAGGAVFVVLFFIGLVIFLWFYIRSPIKPDSAHLASVPPGDLEAAVMNEKLAAPTQSTLDVMGTVPPAVPAVPEQAHVQHTRGPMVVDTPPRPLTPPSPSPPAEREFEQTPTTTTTTTSATPTPRNHNLRVDTPGYDWNRASTSSLEIPLTASKDFV